MTPDDSSVGHLRNAVALLMANEERFVGPHGTQVVYHEDVVTAVKGHLWAAVEQLEQKGKVSDDA